MRGRSLCQVASALTPCSHLLTVLTKSAEQCTAPVLPLVSSSAARCIAWPCREKRGCSSPSMPAIAVPVAIPMRAWNGMPVAWRCVSREAIITCASSSISMHLLPAAPCVRCLRECARKGDRTTASKRGSLSLEMSLFCNISLENMMPVGQGIVLQAL